VKRRSEPPHFPECGFIHNSDILTVYKVSMFAIELHPGRTYGEKLAQIKEKTTYASLGELLGDGWVVD